MMALYENMYNVNVLSCNKYTQMMSYAEPIIYVLSYA